MILDKIALGLAIIGALNWGGIGLFGFDTVAFLFGAKFFSTQLIHRRSWKMKFGKSGFTSAWSFKASTSFPSTQPCKTSPWPGS